MPGDQSYTGGEYIFREGESAIYAYIVKSGTVEITKHGASGEQVLAELAPPTIFGEMALIDGNPRSAGAKAKVDTVVTEVTEEAFLAYLRQNPEAAVRIMKNISENLRTSNQLVAKYERAGADEDTSDSVQFVAEKTAQDFEIDDTDAIYEQGPSKPLLFTALSLLTFFIGSIVFASISQVDTTVSARGEFLTATPNVVVEASASSVVKSVEVERGDKVVKGQIIAYLDDTVVKANLKQNEESLNSVYVSLIRLMMEENLVDDPKTLIQKINYDEKFNELYKEIVKKLNISSFPEDLKEASDDPLVLLYKKALEKKLSEYIQKIKSFDSKSNKTSSEYNSSIELLKISKSQTKIKERLAEVQKSLYDRKIGSLLKYLSAQDALLNAEKTQFNAQSTITNLVSQIETQKADKQAFIAGWASGLTKEITEKNEKMMQLEQEKIKLVRLVNNVVVRSPAEGIVLDIPAVATGGNVSEGEPIVTLVQSNQPLFLEVDIDPKKITDMKLGMNVSIKLDAMPFQEFGGLDGQLIYMSNDTFNESLSGDKGVFYRGRVKVQNFKESEMPKDFVLSQGMLASADIMVGQRALISYFTYPILNAFAESFNEPE
ncbi:HlyD family type I secretion periplasmic adaptor subunit [Rhodospirillaceae bacterium]|nr:HlyD family type I secretion periplasmic adaptor subunit [Rhodospirillaceae bacterium]